MYINFWLRLLSCLAIAPLLSGCGIAAYEAKMTSEQERLKYFDKEEDLLTGPVDRPRDPPKKDPNSKEPDLADVFFRPPKGISTKFTENDKPYGPYFQRYQRTATNCAFLEVSVAALNDKKEDLASELLKPFQLSTSAKKVEEPPGRKPLEFREYKDRDTQPTLLLYLYQQGSTRVAVVYRIDTGKSTTQAFEAIKYSLGSLEISGAAYIARTRYLDRMQNVRVTTTTPK